MEYPQLEKLIEVIAKLRDPKDGCPWDLKQTHQSLLKFLIEESYEYVHAVEEEDYSKMEEEIGDVLLQVLLHSQMASESNKFDIESVAKVLADKMIYRHPHVFKDKSIATTPAEVMTNWEKLKAKTKQQSNFFTKDDTCMPALMSAHKIGKKSAQVNFDWDHFSQVVGKVQEEWDEVQVELNVKDVKKNKAKIKEEIGDLLFSTAQLARHLDIDAEEALRDANLKFINRFTKLETLIKSEGKDMQKMSVPELEEYWQRIKKS